MDRNLEGFEASGLPPMTASKREVIGRSDSMVVQEVKTLMHDEAYPFNRDLFTLNDLRDVLRLRIGRPVSDGEAKDAVKECGGQWLERQIRLPGGRKPRPWAIRNHGKWLEASQDEIRGELTASDIH